MRKRVTRFLFALPYRVFWHTGVAVWGMAVLLSSTGVVAANILDVEMATPPMESKAFVMVNLKTGDFFAQVEPIPGVEFEVEKLLHGTVLPSLDPAKAATASMGMRVGINTQQFTDMRNNAYRKDACGGNVYVSSERFVQWASPETVAQITLKAAFTGEAPEDILNYLRWELNDIYTWLESRGTQNLPQVAAAVLEALILQKTDVLPGLTFEWKTVNYIYTITLPGDVETSYPSPRLAFALIWNAPDCDAANNIRQRLDAFDVIQVDSLNTNIIEALAPYIGTNKLIQQLLLFVSKLGVPGTAILQGGMQSLIKPLFTAPLLQDVKQDIVQPGVSPSAPIDLKIPGDNKSEFCRGKDTFPLLPLALGSHGCVVLKQVEFNPSSYTLSVRLTLKHKHSWGTVRKAVDRVTGKGEQFVKDVANKVIQQREKARGFVKKGLDGLQNGFEAIVEPLEGTFNKIGVEARNFRETLQQVPEDFHQGVTTTIEAVQDFGGHVVEVAQGLVTKVQLPPGLGLADVRPAEILTPEQLIFAAAGSQLDDMSRAVFGRPITDVEYVVHVGSLGLGYTVQELRAALAEKDPESLGQQAAIYREVLGYDIDDGTLRSHARLLGSGYFQDLRQLRTHIACSLPEAKNKLVAIAREVRGPVAPPMDATEQQVYCTYLAQGGTQEQVRALLTNHARELEAIYQAVLGRAVDPSGWGTWSRALTAGKSLEQVRHDIVFDAGGEALARLNDIYQTVLGRSIYSDASGKATWLAEFAKPGQTLADVRRKIVFDPGQEAIAHLNDIYQAVLGRSMNDGEWQTQTTRLAQGGTLEQVRGTIAYSGETRNRLEALLGRALADSEWGPWSGRLAAGWSLEQVRKAIAENYVRDTVLPVLHTVLPLLLGD